MIAVTGASGLVGEALLNLLGASDDVTRLVALDVRAPRRRARGVEFHRADVARSELKPLLEGCDTLVHLASVVDPIPDEALMARVNVDGTRRVLDAAAAVRLAKEMDEPMAGPERPLMDGVPGVGAERGGDGSPGKAGSGASTGGATAGPTMLDVPDIDAPIAVVAVTPLDQSEHPAALQARTKKKYAVPGRRPLAV